MHIFSFSKFSIAHLTWATFFMAPFVSPLYTKNNFLDDKTSITLQGNTTNAELVTVPNGFSNFIKMLADAKNNYNKDHQGRYAPFQKGYAALKSAVSSGRHELIKALITLMNKEQKPLQANNSSLSLLTSSNEHKKFNKFFMFVTKYCCNDQSSELLGKIQKVKKETSSHLKFEDIVSTLITEELCRDHVKLCHPELAYALLKGVYELEEWKRNIVKVLQVYDPVTGFFEDINKLIADYLIGKSYTKHLLAQTLPNLRKEAWVK